MNKTVFLELSRSIKSDPRLMRKFKIFAVVGGLGIVLIGTIAIWLGLTAIGYLSERVTDYSQSPQAETQDSELNDEVYQVANFQTASCWAKTQELIALNPWLEKTVMDNFRDLKLACFQSVVKDCSSGNTCI